MTGNGALFTAYTTEYLLKSLIPKTIRKTKYAL
jgi:hypothetical protein